MCGFLLALGRQMYKSKCKEIECFCVRIVRDVESEEKFDEQELARGGSVHQDDISVGVQESKSSV